MSSQRLIDYSQLFEVDDPLATRPFRLSIQQKWVSEGRTWLKICYGTYIPSEPIVLKAYMGGAPSDFLWTGLYPMVCISKRIVDVFLDNKIKGWSTYPVKVFNKLDELLPDYYGLSLTSWVGNEDLDRCEIIYKQPRVPGSKPYKILKGLYFDETKWDGSDIFRVDAAYIVATKQLRDILINLKVTNLKMIPLSNIERDGIIFRR